jgi:ABC-type branched-subunit amino acid transport system substrate-binding protein
VGKWTKQIWAVAALTVLVAVSCSSDGGGSGSASEDAESTTPPTTEAPEFDGEPIPFVVPAASSGVVAQPEIFDAAEAAAEAVNAAGGIEDPEGGPARPLEVIRCEGNEDPDTALQCAQDTIPQDPVAVVGRYLIGADGTQAWADAGIPMIGSLPIETEDYINPAVFPITGGAVAGAGGLAYALQEAGAQTIALITGDVDAGRALPDLFTPALSSPDDLVDAVYVPLDPSADYTPQLTQLASSNPDAVAVFGSSDINVRAISGLRAAGYTGLIGAPAAGLGADGLETLGADAEGLVLAGSFEPASSDSEGITQFNTEMDNHGGDFPRDEYAINAWASVHLLADVLADVDTIDAASVLAALDGRDVDLGVAPPFTLGVADNPTGAPRIFTVQFQEQTVEDGVIVAAGDGEFVDLNDHYDAG